jgi:hypothetical protein
MADNKKNLMIFSTVMLIYQIINGIAGTSQAINNSFPSTWSEFENQCADGKILKSTCQSMEKANEGCDIFNLCEENYEKNEQQLKSAVLVMIVPLILCAALVPCCGVAASKDVGPPGCMLITFMIFIGLGAVLNFFSVISGIINGTSFASAGLETAVEATGFYLAMKVKQDVSAREVAVDDCAVYVAAPDLEKMGGVVSAEA